MSDELAGDVTARKRFVKEAQILSKLRHRYITRFYEFINNDQGAVLVMEFVEGTPVDVLLTERGALSISRRHQRRPVPARSARLRARQRASFIATSSRPT